MIFKEYAMKNFLLVTTAVLFLSACGSSVKLDEVKVEDKTVTTPIIAAPETLPTPTPAPAALVAPVNTGSVSVRPVESVTADSPNSLSALGPQTTVPAISAPTAVQLPEAKVVTPEIQDAKQAAPEIVLPEPSATAPIVYFDYDSFEVRPEFQSLIEVHATKINANKTTRVMIEGHTDERGGREYNLALGQKRAESVRQVLKLLGVVDSQMEAVSFGKEKPASTGTSEDSMAKNRRAVINYR